GIPGIRDDWHPLVDVTNQTCVAGCAKDWQRLTEWINPRHLIRSQMDLAFGVRDVRGRKRKEDATKTSLFVCRGTKCEYAELEAAMKPGEEPLAVLEVVEGAKSTTPDEFGEHETGAIVRGDARR